MPGTGSERQVVAAEFVSFLIKVRTSHTHARSQTRPCTYTHASAHALMHARVCTSVHTHLLSHWLAFVYVLHTFQVSSEYGVATISRLLKIIGL